MISVIVPVYKVEQYLQECVDSILAQSYADFELILVDDGSPDRCGEICDAYAKQDPRVRVIHQENQGLSGARNAGMDIARGEYITFVDSDDLVSPEYLAVLRQALVDSNADFSVGQISEIDSNSVITSKNVRTHHSGFTTVYSGRESCVMLYDGSPEVPVSAWGKLYRTELICDLRFPVGRLHEDQAFTPYVCYRAGRICSVGTPIYYYRTGNESITRARFSLKRYDDVWAIEQCIAFFERQHEKDILKAARRKRKRILATYSIYARRDGIKVPKRYRVSILRALCYLKNHTKPDKYAYYLSQVSPRLARLFEYEMKLKKMLQNTLS